MTFQQLQYLVAARKAGSISKAAKNLFLTPSSISVAITGLEQELGFQIFVRTAQGLIPTIEGEKVLRYAGRILENYRLLDGVHAGQGKVCLNLANHDMMGIAFARLVKENQGKKTFFSVSNFNVAPAIQKLLVNEIDLDVRFAFTTLCRKLESTVENQNLSWKIIATVPTAARVGHDHRLYNAASVTPKELEQETMIEPVNHSFSRSDMIKGFMTIDPEKTIASDNSSVSLRLISGGLGYSIAPLVPDDVDNRFEIHRIPIEGLQYHLYAIHNPRYPQRPEVQRYLELLQEQLTMDLPTA